MARKLKVFRTTAGFNDAYVAAPSQKAALAAWGADVDLFARGIAEVVTDPALTAEPLANPGTVLTVSRGDLAAHLKALEKQSPSARRAGSAPVRMSPAKPAKPSKARKRPPPRRDRLDAAERALEEAEGSLQKDEAELESRRDAAERALARFRAARDRKLATLRRKRDSARDAYQDALDRLDD